MALFKIDKDSIIDASGQGYKYCTTTPDHPRGERRKDRKKRYVYLHRAVMELKLGRFLKDWEQVDHKDGNKSNNSPSNLKLTTNPEHQQEHAKEKKFWKKSPMNKPTKKHESALRVATRFLLAYDTPTD